MIFQNSWRLSHGPKQNVPAPIGKSSEASTSKAVAQNVEKAVVRKNVSDMEDDSPGRPRGEILAAATQSSSNYQDNSMDRSKLHGYKTPPPSRSRSRSHSVEVENNASRLASPVTKSDNQTLHRSDLHNKVRLDAVTASKTASSLVADSGSSQKNVQLVSQGRSQNKSIKSSDQTSSSQKNKKVSFSAPNQWYFANVSRDSLTKPQIYQNCLYLDKAWLT